MGRKSNAKDRILDSAAELIQRQEFSSTSIEDILGCARVKKGSFYHYFDSKQALGLAVLDRQFVYPSEHLFRVFEEDLPPLQQISRFFQATSGHLIRTAQAQGGLVCGCPFGNLAAEMSTRDEAFRCKTVAFFDIFHDQFSAALQRAVEQGELSSDADVDLLSTRLLALWQGSILLAKLHQDVKLYANLVDGALALLEPHRIRRREERLLAGD